MTSGIVLLALVEWDKGAGKERAVGASRGAKMFVVANAIARPADYTMTFATLTFPRTPTLGLRATLKGML